MLDSFADAVVCAIASDAVDRAPCVSNADSPAKFKFSHGGPRKGAGRPRGVCRYAPPSNVLYPALPPQAAPLWYCLRATDAYRGQRQADIELRLAGYEVFNPSIFRPAVSPHCGPNGVLAPGQPDRVSPLFPRYLFVRFNRSSDYGRRIYQMPGVRHVFRASVPESAIDAIRALCADNDCVYPAAPPVVGPGVQLRVRAGHPLADATGFCQASDRTRVKLLLEIMGHAVSVSLSHNDVEPVTEAACWA